jgi:FMN reductase
MPEVVGIAGSPMAPSRSAALLARLMAELEAAGLSVQTIHVRDLPAEDLLHGRYDSPAVRAVAAAIAEARGVVLATPVYKAAYSGALKALLDLLPSAALADKAALALVTGGGPTHALAVEYALGPLLAALGAGQVLAGVYVADNQVQIRDSGELLLDEAADVGLRMAAARLLAAVRQSRSSS